jgi:hypothetical protein
MIERGVPLAHYIDTKPRSGVDVTCRTCCRGRRVEFGPILRALAAKGIDGRRVGIVELARFFKTPCRHCGATIFITRPDIPFELPGEAKALAEERRRIVGLIQRRSTTLPTGRA